MATPIYSKRQEHQLVYEIRQAWQFTKDRVSAYVTDFSLKDLCYGIGVILSGLCVIHARKGKTITAVVLAILTEVTMYKGTANKITQVASTLGLQSSSSDVVPSEKELEPVIVAFQAPVVVDSDCVKQVVSEVTLPDSTIARAEDSSSVCAPEAQTPSQPQEENDRDLPAWIAFIAATVAIVCGRR